MATLLVQGRPSSLSFLPKPTPRRAFPATPSVSINTKLPCTLDQDFDEIPAPNYTPDDIARVQRVLLNFVPAELADAILDLAEYWPYIGASRNDFSTAYSALEGPDQNAQWCYMVSPPIPSVERDGRRVTTTVKRLDFSLRRTSRRGGSLSKPLVSILNNISTQAFPHQRICIQAPLRSKQQPLPVHGSKRPSSRRAKFPRLPSTRTMYARTTGFQTSLHIPSTCMNSARKTALSQTHKPRTHSTQRKGGTSPTTQKYQTENGKKLSGNTMTRNASLELIQRPDRDQVQAF